ncbi:MAG: DUF1272 domain-containing protein [Gammaproteobacteria bacterium]
MLELRPCCENCAVLLPPDSVDAMICTFECTFCRPCVEELANVCPNCGGGFQTRPVRPATNWRNGNYLGEHPPTSNVTHKPVDRVSHKELVERVGDRPPRSR